MADDFVDVVGESDFAGVELNAGEVGWVSAGDFEGLYVFAAADVPIELVDIAE